MSESIVASNVGITEAGQSLLSYSNELSGLFDNVAQVTDSLEANVTGFESIENLILQLKNINSTKDSLISKIKEFGDYLINTVAPGYGDFIKDVEKIDANTDDSLDNLAALLAGGTQLTKSGGNPTPTQEEQTAPVQGEPKTDTNGNTEGVSPTETPKSDTTSPTNTQSVSSNHPATEESNPNVIPSNSNVQWVWDEERQTYMLKPAEGAVGMSRDLVNGAGSGPSIYWPREE